LGHKGSVVNSIMLLLVVAAMVVVVVLAGMDRLSPSPATPSATVSSSATPVASPSAIPVASPLPTASPSPIPAATPTTPGAVVGVRPSSSSVYLNQTVTLSIQAEEVNNLFGLELRLSFDAARLEVLDADGNASNGVQIAPGDFLNVSLGFLALNTVDNTTGKVDYVFALISPATPVSGSGALVRITFRAKGAGCAPITLDRVTLADDLARRIPANGVNGSITVLPGTSSYTVLPGDTLLGIAWRYRVSPWALMAANELTGPILHVGQVLTMP